MPEQRVPPPESEAHRELVAMLTRDMRTSENNMSSRHDEWRRSERTYRLYVDPGEVQEPRDAVQDDSELLYTYPTSIVVPLSYALTQTVVAFWISLFTAETPYFRVSPHDPESEGAARAQELLLNQQLDHVGYVPLLYYWLLDATRYGTGIVKNSWETQYRTQTIRRFLDLPGPDGQPIKIQVKQKREVLEYEGNYPEIIDPFQWRPDVRWPLNQFQRGGYCGEAMYRSHDELRLKEDQGLYEHVEDIKKFSAEHFRGTQSDRDRIMQANNYFGFSYREEGLVLVEELAKDIRPSQYQLAGGDRLERWLFVLANKSVVIRAEPFPYDHNDYTYALAESSPDFHSLTNPGLVEIMEPIHQHITWFTNSILEDARKTLNDRLVVDPYIINMDDVLSPSAGKAIRVNEDFWGVPGAVKNGIEQLKVTSVSSLNYQHIGFLVDLLQRVSAANETVQGQIQEEERTATEISSAANLGAQRLRVMARFLSTTGLVPLARQMAQNNMQLMTQEQYIRQVGSLERDFQGIGRAIQGGGVMISPEDIQGLFHFPVHDANAPLDPVRFARTWVQVMQISAQNPMIAQQINHPAIWIEMIRSMGIRDPARFLIPQMQIMPDQQIQQQVQAGNLVPQQPAGMNGATPPLRSPIPAQAGGQTIQGEENRPQ